MPVAEGDRGAADEQRAGLAVGHLAAVGVADLEVVARDGRAGGARADVVGTVGQEDVQCLGRADAVEDLDPEALGEPALERGREHLARGGAQAHRGEGVVGQRAAHEGGVEGGDPEEQRRPVALEPLAHDVRGRPARLQHGGRAHREREEDGVADAVGEEHLRHREGHVVLGDAEHLPAVGLADVADVGVAVHRRLGQAGRAGGVEPQRPGVVAGGRARGVAARPAASRSSKECG